MPNPGALGRAVLVGSLALAATVRGSAAELDKVLARPVTPGALVLLSKYKDDPRVEERLILALKSPDADTRGTAARVVSLTALSSLLPAVGAALAIETDADAAREQARVLVKFGGPDFDSNVFSAAQRLAPAMDRDILRMFARVRGPEAFPLYFDRLRSLALPPADHDVFFRLASRGDAKELGAASSIALQRNDPAGWTGVLRAALQFNQRLETPVLLEALRSSDEAIRGEAAWYLAGAHWYAPPSDASELLAAVTAEAGTKIKDPELRFGSEMLARILGREAVEDEEWISGLPARETCHLDSDPLESSLSRFLTPREREAMTLRSKARSLPSDGVSPHEVWASPMAGQFRMITGFPRGAVSDLLRIEGCDDEDFSALAKIVFRNDGVPRRVSVTQYPAGSACRRTTESLFLLLLAPENALLRGEDFHYAALFDSDQLQCSQGSALEPYRRSASTGRRDPDRIVPPRLTKRVEPLYSESNRKAGLQGVSIFEAVVTKTGCVRDLTLLKSSHLPLDIAGMQAISQWRYRPATLDGQPATVHLTVTTTFSLK